MQNLCCLKPDMEPVVEDLSLWMTNLPQNIREVPLTQLAIPGDIYSIIQSNECAFV